MISAQLALSKIVSRSVKMSKTLTSVPFLAIVRFSLPLSQGEELWLVAQSAARS
jgi:hypothetical protein